MAPTLPQPIFHYSHVLHHVRPVEIGLNVSKIFIPAWMGIIWGIVEPIDFPLVLDSRHSNAWSVARQFFTTSVLDDVIFEEDSSLLRGRLAC